MAALALLASEMYSPSMTIPNVGVSTLIPRLFVAEIERPAFIGPHRKRICPVTHRSRRCLVEAEITTDGRILENRLAKVHQP